MEWILIDPAKTGLASIRCLNIIPTSQLLSPSIRSPNLPPINYFRSPNGNSRMWCPSCQAEVAAEVTVDNRRVRCATCGSEVALSPNLRTSVRTREARELLERWANDRQTINDPIPAAHFSDQGSSAPAHEAAPSPKTPSAGGEHRPKLKFRVDRAHTPPATAPEPVAETASEKAEQHILNVRARERAINEKSSFPAPERFSGPHASFDQEVRPVRSPRIHQRHAQPIAPPHFNVQSIIQHDEPTKTNWSSIAGQLLAYGGVALLTVGSSLVLWGYFGGPETYAPTGWLVTTAGQMLLFLGVVTLVSGGMEQTTEEVRKRIDHLGDRFLRYEQAAHQLRGPYVPAEHYDDPSLAEADEEAAYQESLRQQRGQSRGRRR